jgi:hypothetical protein
MCLKSISAIVFQIYNEHTSAGQASDSFKLTFVSSCLNSG